MIVETKYNFFLIIGVTYRDLLLQPRVPQETPPQIPVCLTSPRQLAVLPARQRPS